MEHPLIITSDNKIVHRRLVNLIQEAIKMIESWPLQKTAYIMRQEDYDDIVKWGA